MEGPTRTSMSVTIFENEFKCFGFGFVLKPCKRKDYQICRIHYKEPWTVIETPKGMRIYEKRIFRANNLKH